MTNDYRSISLFTPEAFDQEMEEYEALRAELVPYVIEESEEE